MSELRLFNSLTRALEPFAPIHPGEARVYSCGPTVYNYQHVGNMRAYVFADTLGRTRPASVGLDPANNPQGTNYAWGGAQASATGGSLLLPSVGQQVNSYINGRGNIPNNPLYVFWAGGNDLLNAATAAGATPASINAAKDNAIAALKSSIQRLFDRIDPNQPAQVLWANLPSLDRVPAAAALPANLRTALRDASAAFALEQGQAITDLVEPVANRYIYGLDIYGLFNQILDNPAAYGFANTTNPVIVTPDFARPGPFNPTLAVPPGTNPDGFVFWDPIHPTSHVHALIGNAAAAVIPAPGVGVFAAVGLLAARRRRVAV